MFRNFINAFIDCKYIFTIFKNDFLLLCIVTASFTNVNNLYNIFLIFYGFLNFCDFTSFGSVKVVIENFIISIFYFIKSLI